MGIYQEDLMFFMEETLRRNYMVENTARVVSIYLEDWQMRLIKDVKGEVCHIWDVPVEGPI